MSALFGLPWRWVGVAAFVILLGVVYIQVKHTGRLEAQLDAATEIANANAEIASQERMFRQKADAVASANAAMMERARRKYSALRKEVTDAGSEEDGAIAPVLRHALDGLPKLEESSAIDRGPPGRAALPSQLSGGPDTSRP